MAAAPEVLLAGLSFPESPRWRDGLLWFSDFYTGRVQTLDPAGRASTVVEVPQRPSGLGFAPDGALLVVSMKDRRVLKLAGTQTRTYADLSSIATGHCNDMLVDGQGRAYVGNFGYDRHAGEAPRAACIARVDPDGAVFRAAGDMAFPNGMALTPDGRTLIVAESLASKLTAFDVDAGGALSGRRTWAEIPDALPDGICLDVEGALWVADARGHRVVRVFEGGRIADCVSIGERHAYACMLGGHDRRTLFIATCSSAGPAVAVRRDGRIEALGVEVPGAGLP